MLGARSVAGNRFDTFTEKSHSLRWAATRVLYCPWDWRTPSDRRNSAQTPTSAGFRRVSHRSRIVHIAGMAPKWTVRSVCSCTLSLSGRAQPCCLGPQVGLCRDQDLASVDGPLCRGLQRQTRRVLAVGLPVRRQRPADELPGAGRVAGTVPQPPGLARRGLVRRTCRRQAGWSDEVMRQVGEVGAAPCPLCRPTRPPTADR